jgi:hypothetical protein
MSALKKQLSNVDMYEYICVCVCVYVCMYVCTYVRRGYFYHNILVFYTWLYIDACADLSAIVYTHTCARAHTHTHTHTHAHAHAHTHVFITQTTLSPVMADLRFSSHTAQLQRISWKQGTAINGIHFAGSLLEKPATFFDRIRTIVTIWINV